MEPKDKKRPDDPSDAELYALYNSGAECTVSFIKLLLDRVKGIETIVKRQSEEIQQLKSIISKDSHNSHKPPASDGNKKKPVIKNLRKKGKNKSGGQIGHPGTNLKMSEKPDIITPIHIESCDCCGEKKNIRVTAIKKRQSIDIQIKRVTNEYQADVGECGRCGNIIVAKFPDYITQDVQYSPTVKSLIVYMRNLNFLPTDRLAEIFKDIFGIPISEGTIYNTTKKLSRILHPFDALIRDKLKEAQAVFFDESGTRIEGNLHWVLSASTPLLTCYFPHKKRGKVAMDAMGVLPGFKGIAIHDAWPSYFDYSCLHGLCNAHHLRELIFMHEELHQRWAKRMISLLLEIKEKTDKTRVNGKTISKKTIIDYEKHFKRILYAGYQENPIIEDQEKKRGRKKKGKVLCLLDRFKTRMHQVLAFMYDNQVPFDNNQAERDIRMAKLYQKISGCFRTMEGAVDFFRIRSYISTMRKQKGNVLAALKNLFTTCQFNGIMAE